MYKLITYVIINYPHHKDAGCSKVLNYKELIRVQYSAGDRVELIVDYGGALKKGRQGEVIGFPNGEEEQKRLSYVRFDHYTGGVRLVANDKLKKI